MNELSLHIRILRLVSAVILFAIPIVISAQSVIALPPSTTASLPASTGGKRLVALSNIASALPRGAPIWQRGPFAVRPHLLYRLLYGDGLLNAGQTESGNSIVQSIAAGFLFELGQRWTLDYTLTKTIYSNEFLTDSSGHAVVFSGGFSGDAWTLGIGQSYSTDSPTLVETGEQTKQEYYSTELSGTYQLGTRTLLGVSVQRSVRNANASASKSTLTTVDWLSWSTTGSVRYQFSPQLEMSFILSQGYDDLSIGADMNYTRPQARVSWRPTDRLSLTAQGGYEMRRFENGGKDDVRNPVYSVSAAYNVTQTTALSFSGNRQLSVSYFANQGTRNTGFQAGLEQRLLRRYFLSVGFGAHQTDYFATANGVTGQRKDKGTTTTARVSAPLFSRGSAALFYQVGHNSSNEIGFGFTSHQVGCEFAYRF